MHDFITKLIIRYYSSTLFEGSLAYGNCLTSVPMFIRSLLSYNSWPYLSAELHRTERFSHQGWKIKILIKHSDISKKLRMSIFSNTQGTHPELSAII